MTRTACAGVGRRGPLVAVEEATGRRLVIERVTVGAAGGWPELSLVEHGARVAAGLSHPGIVHVAHCGLDDRGDLLVVREPLDGGTLEERLRRQHRRLDRHAFRALLESLLRTLAYLHSLLPPVIYRGICPAAIGFRTDSDWRPVLTGVHAIAPPPWHPAASCLVGVDGYAAPEQLRGDWSPASDLYAVGATMLFVATHSDPLELPMRGGRFDVGDQLSVVDAEVRAVLLRLVEPDVHERYQAAEDALFDLERPAWSRRAARVRYGYGAPAALGWYASAFVWLALILVPLFVMLFAAVTYAPPALPPPPPATIKPAPPAAPLGASDVTPSACSARTSA